MTYYGDLAPAASVVFNFNTAAFSDGSPITLAGTPTLACYKNSTTESTAGVTLTVDYDSRTGMHHVVIDTSSDGTFYAAGNDFSVVITAGTVGGTSVVGRVVGSFSLNNRSALRPATAGRTIAVDGSGGAPVSVGTGAGQINASSGKVPATLASTDVTGNVAADLQTIKTQTITCAAGVTVGAFVGNATQAVAVDLSGNVTFNNTTIGTATNVTNVVSANVVGWGGTNVAGAIPPDVVFLRSGTAQAGGTSTITLDSGASATNNFYQNAVVFIRSGTGAGQCALITTYVGSTKVATINGTWATNPDVTSVFSLLPFGAISASVSGNVTVGGYAGGQDPASYILVAPANKLTTDGSGDVTFNNSSIGSVTGNVGGNVTGNVGGSVASVTAGVTVTTNNDKTGYSLTQTFPTHFSALSIDTNGRVELQSGVTKNVALNNFEFLMVSSSDHVTPVTGATVTAQRSIDGSGFGSCANAVVEVGSGIYKINLAASDMNGGVITLQMTAFAADARYVTLVTTP